MVGSPVSNGKYMFTDENDDYDEVKGDDGDDHLVSQSCLSLYPWTDITHVL